MTDSKLKKNTISDGLKSEISDLLIAFLNVESDLPDTIDAFEDLFTDVADLAFKSSLMLIKGSKTKIAEELPERAPVGTHLQSAAYGASFAVNQLTTKFETELNSQIK